ncbi:MAG TPA: MarR family transcriptional regulator [Chloroflexota bacterium]|nr:MarR family transcriptional regulator [Chloroflexota bacterium]
MVDNTPREDLRALADFRYTMRRFLQASERMARARGLTPQQHQLLLAIAGRSDEAEPTIGFIAERLLLKHHSAVGLVDRLVEADLVAREPHPSDRRQVLVRLTEKGSRVLDDLASSHRQEIRLLAPRLINSLDTILHHQNLLGVNS